MKDALGRRKRFGGSEPTGARVMLQPRDEKFFCALQTHGMLPSHYLHVFSGSTLEPKTEKQKQLSQVIKSTSQRLTQLHHDGGYTLRPEKQKAGDNNKGQLCTYELAPKAIEYLQIHDLANRYSASFDGHPSHQFGLSCVTASIQLAAERKGFRYISQEEIFRDARCTSKKLELNVSGEKIKPDQLFGIRYKDGAVRFFAVELERSPKGSKRYEAKLQPYDTIINKRIYRDAWGIPNLRVLVPTVSQVRVDLMKKQLDTLANKEHFLFRSKSFIAADWEVPPIMYDLFDDPWQTVNGYFYIDRAKLDTST